MEGDQRNFVKVIVETDEANPTTIAEIASNKVNVADGYRVRLMPGRDQKMNKKEFLDTELGRSLKRCIQEWDKAIIRRGSTRYFDQWDSICVQCRKKWEVFKMTLEQFYGVSYHFIRTNEYFGLVTEDELDWLIKVERKLTDGLPEGS